MMDPNFERENMVSGIKRLILMIAAVVFLIIVTGFFFSCSPRVQAIEPEGKIIERDGDRYLILWPDVGGETHRYHYQWVYQPGMAGIEIKELEAFITIKPRNKNEN